MHNLMGSRVKSLGLGSFIFLVIYFIGALRLEVEVFFPCGLILVGEVSLKILWSLVLDHFSPCYSLGGGIHQVSSNNILWEFQLKSKEIWSLFAKNEVDNLYLY